MTLIDQDVTFQSGDATICGTITTPRGSGPHPAVVFIPGSGPSHRERYRSHAQHFAQRGIASLSCDKRGVGGSSGDWRRATFDDLAADALAGIRVLQSYKYVDAQQIGLCGRSQGGWIAPLVASQSEDITFMILVSGPGVSPAEQVLYRIESAAGARGFPASLTGSALLAKRMLDSFTRTAFAGGRLQGIGTSGWAPRFVNRAYRWAQVMDFDPVPVLENVTCQVLAVFGETDTVVPVERSIDVVRRCLTRGECDDLTVAVIPQADHQLRGSDGEFAPRLL